MSLTLNENTEKRSNNNPTDLIVIIADRSGSMMSMAQEAENGLNDFIKQSALVEGRNCDLALTEFDREVDQYEICDCRDVDNYKLVPRSSTALFDAIGMTLNDLPVDTATKYDKVIVQIVTDGQENTSQEWTQATVKELIKEKQEAGFEFIFVGANIDAYSAGMSLNIGSSSVVQLTGSSGQHAKAGYDATTLYSTQLRSSSKSVAEDSLAQTKLQSADIE
jgi:hypothetical protein